LSGLGIPFVQAIGLWLLAAASAITVCQRFAVVYRQASAITPAVTTPVTTAVNSTAVSSTAISSTVQDS
jgi:hypothetical protein